MVARDGRDFLVSDVAAIPATYRPKCAGASVGMTNERGRRVFAGFEVMAWVALADGVARWPLEKQRQTQEKSLTPEGVIYRRRPAH